MELDPETGCVRDRQFWRVTWSIPRYVIVLLLWTEEIATQTHTTSVATVPISQPPSFIDIKGYRPLDPSVQPDSSYRLEPVEPGTDNPEKSASQTQNAARNPDYLLKVLTGV